MNYLIKEEETLLVAVAKMAPDSSNTSRREWIKQGRIVKIGQKIELLRAEGYQKPLAQGVRILYQDQHIVAIYKPSGLLSVASLDEKEATAHGVLKRYFSPRRVFVVHRLDQDTSGVMLFALTEEARDSLKSTFELHNIKRHYTAIVEGKFPIGTCGSWECYLYEDKQYHVHPVEEGSPHMAQAKLAITRYSVLSSKGPFSRLDLQLETGRKNQIRVHCQRAGCPVIGDAKYGYKGSHTKRLALHAYLLELAHPITKKMVRFSCEEPPFFSRICA